MKTLRNNEGAGIRFYACGEYGDQLKRPHYHLCLFNYRPDDLRLHQEKRGNRLYTSKKIDSYWQKGFSLIGELTFETAAYTARYIMKKQTGKIGAQHYEKLDQSSGETIQIQPEFTNMSRRPGIGQQWFQKYNEEVYLGDFVVIKGKKMRPPRYYDQQMQTLYPDYYDELKGERVRTSRKHRDNNTSGRHRVRETVQKARISNLNRTYEREDQC